MKINESTLRKIIREELSIARLNESDETLRGLEAMLSWRTKFTNALETALVDLKDGGCPSNEFAYKHILEAISELEDLKISRDSDPLYVHGQFLDIMQGTMLAALNCRDVDESVARRVHGNISRELKRYGDWSLSDDFDFV